MAAVPIYIIGTITMKSPKGGEVDSSGIEQCVISGLASIEGLGVGGGPIIPPPGEEKPPRPPLGIWPGPGDPDFPGRPPGGEKPPEIPPGSPPPVTWKPVWHPTEGWVVVGIINPDISHPVPSKAQPVQNPQKP